MILGNQEIRGRLRASDLVIDPFEPTCLNECTYVLRLDRYFRSWQDGDPVNVAEPIGDDHLSDRFQLETLRIKRGDFFLGASLEKLSIPNDLVGMLSTTSHMARFGLSFVQSSTVVRPGFGIHIPTAVTYEISMLNPSTVMIPALTPVCHLMLVEVSAFENLASVETSRSIYEGLPAPSSPQPVTEWARRKRQLENGSSG